MANQKNRLPKSVIVLNIIMIVIVLVICGLLISLLYGDQLKPETPPTVEVAASATTEAEAGGEAQSSWRRCRVRRIYPLQASVCKCRPCNQCGRNISPR